MRTGRRAVSALLIAALIAGALPKPANAIPCPAFPVPVLSFSEIGKALAILERIRGILNGSVSMNINFEALALAAGAPKWVVETAVKVANGAPFAEIALGVATPFLKEYVDAGIDFATDEFKARIQQLAELGINVNLEDLALTAAMAKAVKDQNFEVLMAHPYISPYVMELERGLTNATRDMTGVLTRMSKDIADGVLDEALGFGEHLWDVSNADALIEQLKEHGLNKENLQALLDSAKSGAEKLAELRNLLAQSPEAALNWILAQDGLSLNVSIPPELQAAWEELLRSPERLAAIAAALGQTALNLVQWGELVNWFSNWEFDDQLASLGLATVTLGAISKIAEAVGAVHQGFLQHVCPEYRGRTEYDWRSVNAEAPGLDQHPDSQSHANALPVMPIGGALKPGATGSETLDRRRLREVIAIDRSAAGWAMANIIADLEPELLQPPDDCETLSCETEFYLALESQRLEQALLALQIAIVRLQIEQAATVARSSFNDRP